MSNLSTKERRACDTVRKRIQRDRALAETIDNQLIAVVPPSLVYWHFKALLKLFKKNFSIRAVNAFCRQWYDKAVLSQSDPVFLCFLEICSHEWAHFKLNHAEREDRGEITQKQAEAEADEFQGRVAEMLQWVEVADVLFQDEKARLKETGVL